MRTPRNLKERKVTINHYNGYVDHKFHVEFTRLQGDTVGTDLDIDSCNTLDEAVESANKAARSHGLEVETSQIEVLRQRFAPRKFAVVRLFEEQVDDRHLNHRILVNVFDQAGNRVHDERDGEGLAITATMASKSQLRRDVEELRQAGYIVCLIDEIHDNII
jgi:hypothetical protein